MQEICTLSILHVFSQTYLIAIFVKILAFCNFSKSLFKSKLLQCKPPVRIFFSNHLTAQKLPLFVFEKFIDCDWPKKHVTISYVFKMATALKTVDEEFHPVHGHSKQLFTDICMRKDVRYCCDKNDDERPVSKSEYPY